MAGSLLGGQMEPIQLAISQKTGLPPAVVGKVLAIATPLVLGYVGKMFTGQNMDRQALTSLLGEQSKMAMLSSPEVSDMAGKLLGSQKDVAGATGIFRKLVGK